MPPRASSRMCGRRAGEAIDDATELAARNLAAEYGEREFDEAGYPIDDEGLACEATATDDATALDISCSGMTEDESEAALTGTTSEIPGASITELEGEFTGHRGRRRDLHHRPSRRVTSVDFRVCVTVAAAISAVSVTQTAESSRSVTLLRRNRW